jgi:hypothetical protein
MCVVLCAAASVNKLSSEAEMVEKVKVIAAALALANKAVPKEAFA